MMWSQFIYQAEVMANQRVSPGGLASPEASVFAAHFPANIIRRSHPPELPKGVPEGSESGPHHLVQAGPDRQQKARMVVDDGERVDRAPPDLDRALEVALPQLVGPAPLEELDGRGLRPAARPDPPAPRQDVGDRPNARAIDTMIINVYVDFPGSPAVGVAHLEDGLLQVGIGPSWRAMGPTRAILQAVGRLLAIAPQPLGSCLATDVEVGADPQDRPMERDDLVDEGETEFGHGQDLPGHAAPPFRGSSMAENCHPCPCTVCHPCPCTAQQVVRATRDVTLC